jgi:putative ABC transport system permease protein
MMDNLLQDLRYAARRLLRSPGFTAVALLTLALGIGANSAIFTVVHGVLLRSLPFAEPEALVAFGTVQPGEAPRAGSLSPPDFMSLRDQATGAGSGSPGVLADAVAFVYGAAALTGEGEPQRVEAAWVSAGFFEIFGAAPVLGRSFTADENRPGDDDVAVLGHGFWLQAFGGDPGVVGRTVTVNGVSRTVVGVAPPGFDFPDRRVLWSPIPYGETFSSETAVNRRAQYLSVVGRLRPGVSVAQARAEVTAIAARLEAEFPETNTNVTLAMLPLREVVVGEVRTPLLVLLGAVGFVLLIACANVANLLLARAAARQSEMALRTALGAARGRLVGQLLTESLLLGLLGGALGLLLAYAGTDLLLALRPEGIPRLDDVGVDATVIGFTLAVSLGTGLLFGLVPALHVTRADLTAVLAEAGRGGPVGRQGQRTRSLLVVAEVALAVMLLVGAGLLMRSFLQLQQVDPGFRPEQALATQLSLPARSYPDDDRRAAFYGALIERLEALPGVTSVGAVNVLPMSDDRMVINFAVRGREPLPPGEQPTLDVRLATPDYLRAMGIPLLRGRAFSDRDRADAPQVALINEAAAQRHFPGEDPIGQFIRLGWGRAEGEFAGGEVVGIVGDVRQLGLADDFLPEIYLPHAQAPEAQMSVVVRTAGDPLTLAGAIRAEVRSLDPNLPVGTMTTLDHVVSRSVAQPRFYLLLLGIFAAVSLTLTAVGIFGVMSYAVVQRTREIGIRMALGAAPGAVLRMVIGGALALAVGGMALGLGGALVLTRVLESLVFGVSTTDPLTYAGVAGALTAVVLLASYIPARRATRVDPAVALRGE